MNCDLGIRYYIAVHAGFEEDGKSVWEFVEDFSTQKDALKRLAFYKAQGKTAQVIPAKLVIVSETMVQ